MDGAQFDGLRSECSSQWDLITDAESRNDEGCVGLLVFVYGGVNIYVYSPSMSTSIVDVSSQSRRRVPRSLIWWSLSDCGRLEVGGRGYNNE